eukprot:jgi/Mesvir1/15923/Mv08247-RA.1
MSAKAPCKHLQEFKHLRSPAVFQTIQHALLKQGQTPPAGSPVPSCSSCHTSWGRMYSCLQCGSIGCWSRGHCSNHSKAAGHLLAIDMERSELYCCACRDYVYDAEFDRILLGARSAAAACSASDVASSSSDANTRPGDPWASSSAQPLVLPPSKRKRLAPFQRPAVNRAEIDAKSETVVVDKPDVPLGLRGINNMGNTCFMSSVLQALLHTPPLRNHFLCDRHAAEECQAHKGGPGASGICLGCELDAIFVSAFSGARTPFSPANFLHSWWRYEENLASYEQQDAHEFLISTISAVHNGARSSSSKHASKDCRCIIHRVFSGTLRSDVMCAACGYTSTTIDPFMDISLDIEVPFNAPGQYNAGGGNAGASGPLSPQTKAVDGGAGAGGPGAAVSSPPALPGSTGARGGGPHSGGARSAILTGCLDRFVRPERLGPSAKFYCKRCCCWQESLKQMSVKQLPLVLCFHMKRFEHSATRKASRKIDRFVRFPIRQLDMAPYLSSSILRLRHGNRVPAAVGEGADDGSDGMDALYQLFAVVSHSGQMDSGHYVTFLRVGAEWYRCDDAWLTSVDEGAVRAAQAYLLFYVKKRFGYYQAGEAEAEATPMADSPDSPLLSLPQYAADIAHVSLH